MNRQYSRVGKTYPKKDRNVLCSKSTRDLNSFSMAEENNLVQSPINSTVSRFLGNK
jgi:hypothetical protein